MADTEIAVKLNVRRNTVLKDELLQVAGQRADPPLRRLAIISVVENPYLDRFEAELSPLVTASVSLAAQWPRAPNTS